MKTAYQKTKTLLSSMALRWDHGFGLLDEKEQIETLETMSKIYDEFLNGKTDEEISKTLDIYIVSVSQIREEVYGEGFFKPDAKSEAFYKQFLKNND